MKDSNSGGMVRKIDDLGRYCIAKEIRKTLRIESGDQLAQYVAGKRIIIEKFETLARVLENEAKNYLKAFCKAYQVKAAICGRDQVICASPGTGLKPEMELSDTMRTYVKSAEPHRWTAESERAAVTVEPDSPLCGAIIPIRTHSESLGALVVLEYPDNADVPGLTRAAVMLMDMLASQFD